MVAGKIAVPTITADTFDLLVTSIIQEYTASKTDCLGISVFKLFIVKALEMDL